MQGVTLPVTQISAKPSLSRRDTGVQGVTLPVTQILAKPSLSRRDTGAACQTRTDDLRFTKPLLYQLS